VGRCPVAYTCVTVYAWLHNLDSHVAARAAFNAHVSGAWPISHLWPPNQAAGWNVHEHVDANYWRGPARDSTM
jgi:hypothetical protein